jgi:hypothetical protein
MKNLIAKIIALGIVSSLISCSSKSDTQKAADHTNQSIDQAKKDVDSAVDDSKKSLAAAVEMAKDAVASGGQPGNISLVGGIVDGDSIDSRISLTAIAGLGWRGNRPTVDSGVISLKPELTLAQKKEIENLEPEETYVNFGCDESVTQNATLHLKPMGIPSAPSQSMLIVKANTVFVCYSNQLTNSMILIEAQTLILHSMAIARTGSLDQMLSFNVGELVLEGTNSIESSGTDGETTLAPGPTISIAANQMTGSGTLKILALGSNYQATTIRTATCTTEKCP